MKYLLPVRPDSLPEAQSLSKVSSMQQKRIQKSEYEMSVQLSVVVSSCSPSIKGEDSGGGRKPQYHCKDSLASVGCFLPELNLAFV